MDRTTAIVTGACGGIGSAISRTLAVSHDVVGIYRHATDETRAHWQEQCGAAGTLVQTDLTDHAATMEVMQALVGKRGAPSVLVNCAGITDDAMFRKMRFEQWERVIRTNLVALFSTTQLVFSAMCEAGAGVVVNIGSVNGERGQAGQCNYAAAKAGLHGFTMSLAREGARYGVRAVTVSPGYTQTPMIDAIREDVRDAIRFRVPKTRFPRPGEIAAPVGFLASPGAAYITGADIPVNGGLHIA